MRIFRDADELSLIDASERRWTTGNAAVYDKGMLVAFLYDLAIRKRLARENVARESLPETVCPSGHSAREWK